MRLKTELGLLIRLCAFWRDSFQSFACFVCWVFFVLTSVTDLVVDGLHINRPLAFEGRGISDTWLDTAAATAEVATMEKSISMHPTVSWAGGSSAERQSLGSRGQGLPFPSADVSEY